MSTVSTDLIIDYLAQGIPTSAIAAAVGCTDSYISQIKALPETQEQIAARQVAHTVADVEFDTRLERTESAALDKIEQNLPFANLGQALAAFRILNSARRRKDGILQPEVGGSTTVNVTLTLPAVAIPRYVTSQQNEIIEVEGKTMMTATPKSLDSVLSARAGTLSLESQQPMVATLNRAANILQGISTPRAQASARKLPPALSADVL